VSIEVPGRSVSRDTTAEDFFCLGFPTSIEGVYNQKRFHASLGYVTPSEYAREEKHGADFCPPIVNTRALDAIFAIKTERALQNDFTASHNKKLYQIYD